MWLRVPFGLAIVVPLIALRTPFPDAFQVFVISFVAFGGGRGLELLAQRSRYKVVIMLAAAGAALAVALLVRARLDAPAQPTPSAQRVKLTPTKPPERPVTPNETLPGHWTAVAASDQWGAAISAETGAVHTWDARPQPQLPIERTPERLAGTDGAERVSVGFNHACALRAGTAVCWGWNFAGEVGRPSRGTDDYANPVVAALPVKLVDVSAGTGHTCGVDTEGGVWCWGANANGECGVDGQKQITATRVAGLPPAIAVQAGFHATCALTGEHRVLCWGDREFLGNGSSPKNFGAKPELVSGDLVVTSFGLGERGGCALDANGNTKCWGENMVPTPAHLDGAVELAIGDFHACALQADRTVVCWGKNWYGQLGDGTRNEATKPVVVRDVRGVRSLAAGASDTCAILEDGQLVCWGRFDHGRI